MLWLQAINIGPRKEISLQTSALETRAVGGSKQFKHLEAEKSSTKRTPTLMPNRPHRAVTWE